jgi:hypothetical protein
MPPRRLPEIRYGFRQRLAPEKIAQYLSSKAFCQYALHVRGVYDADARMSRTQKSPQFGRRVDYNGFTQHRIVQLHQEGKLVFATARSTIDDEFRHHGHLNLSSVSLGALREAGTSEGQTTDTWGHLRQGAK